MAGWAVLGVAAALFHDQLDATGRGWWIWTPPAGIVLGLLGLLYLRVRRDRNRP